MKLFATLLISLSICMHSVAQLSFVRDQNVQVIDDSVPLKNAWAGGLNFPEFWPIDLNGDGIMDLVVYGPTLDFAGHHHLMPFLNTGDSGKVSYQYAPQYIDFFPSDLKGWIATYDYNCDGKMDLFTESNCYCGIEAYRNDYTLAGGLKFTSIADPMLAYYGSQHLNIPANLVAAPSLQDVDGDGIMDVVGWIVTTTAQLGYYRGLAIDSGWSCDSLRFNHVTDCWGGVALSVGQNCPTFGLACREMKPDSALLWDYGKARMDDTQSCICLYQQDGDIDKDLLIGGFNDNNVAFAHNKATMQGNIVVKDSFDYANCNWPAYSIEDTLVSFPCSYNLDVNNDAHKDVIVAPRFQSDYKAIQYYKNISTGDTPIFIRQPGAFLQDEMIDVGTSAAPQIFDINCDGLPDLLIGDNSYYVVQDTPNIPKGIAFYKNIGTPTSPKFKLQTRDFAGLNELNGLNGPFTMTFGDINGDGYPDMIVGSGDGQLYYFQNAGSSCSATNFIPPTGAYMNIDVGGNSVPQLYDLSHDGKLDLVVGNSEGIIKYYQNTGTHTSPFFSNVPTKDMLGGINTALPGYTTGYASPVFYNDSGTDKLIVGTESGKVYVYDNITGNITGNYHLADSLINGEEGAYLIPTIGDINGDGYPDMVIGNNDGGVSLFVNKYGPNGINELHKNIVPTFNAYPNPAADELHLDFYNLENSHPQLMIVNSIGQMIYKESLTAEIMTLPLNNLSSGIYLVRLVSTDYTQSVKIIISR